MISNDNVAQLLCAIYNQKPWLAVKRLSLFEAENYPTIFTPETFPEQIVLVDLIRERVQRGKNSFPEEYRRSWQLTALIASYLVGQLMRAGHQALLDNPAAALGDRNTLEKLLDELVRHAAGTLTIRSDNKKQHEDFDDFKVDFKRESALKELGTDARAKYLYHKTVSEGE